MKLHTGESKLWEEGASHYHNFIAVGGTLVITDQRLHFHSAPTAFQSHEVDIPLTSVASVDFFKTMFMVPNGIAIMNKEGHLEHFIVDDRKSFRDKVNQLLGTHAQASK